METAGHKWVESGVARLQSEVVLEVRLRQQLRERGQVPALEDTSHS